MPTGGRSLTAMALLLATGANAFAPASMFTGSLRRASAVSSRPQLRAARLSMSAETDAGTARGVGDRDSGRHLDDTTEREKAVADLYGPFWEYAAGQLKELGVDLSSYPIPDGYERKEAVMGKGKRAANAITQSYAYQTPKLRQIRAAHVNGGAALQVLNFVVFPHLNYDLPFLGLDLVTLPGGHLIAIDMQPLFADKEYKAKYYGDEALAMHAKHSKNLPWGGDFPEEAQQFFSPAFLWTRPSEDSAVATHVFDAYKEYLAHYLDLVKKAEPITDPKRLEEIKARQIAYLNYRATKDPARGMFTRMYGAEWTEEYIHGFLFDLEEKMEKGLYKAGEKLEGGGPINFVPTPVP